MDTNDKQFQDALQNLTAAFFNFLDIVNPNSIRQTEDLKYISLMLQNIASRLTEVKTDGSPNASSVVVSQPPLAETPPLANTPPPVSSEPVFPDKPNKFRESAYYSKEFNQWVFDRLRPLDGDSKLFRFFISGEEGKFAMKTISGDKWQAVFEIKDRILVPKVVEVEGEITPSAKLEFVDFGRVRKAFGTDNTWLIEKPCRVKVIPV